MEVLIPIIAILMVFGAPTYIVKRILDHRMRRLELENGAAKELESMREERKLLVSRLDALEEIVSSGDFELNQKLRQIALDEAKGQAGLPSAAVPALPKGSAD